MCYQCDKPRNIAFLCNVNMVVIEGNLATDNSKQGEANECGEVIVEDGWDPEANFTKSVEICEYALTLIIYNTHDVMSSNSL